MLWPPGAGAFEGGNEAGCVNVRGTAARYHCSSGKGRLPPERVVVLAGSQQEGASPFLLQPLVESNREPAGKTKVGFEQPPGSQRAHRRMGLKLR